MPEEIVQLITLNNALVVPLTAKVVEALYLDDGDEIEVEQVADDTLRITPVLTQKQLATRFNAGNRPGPVPDVAELSVLLRVGSAPARADS